MPTDPAVHFETFLEAPAFAVRTDERMDRRAAAFYRRQKHPPHAVVQFGDLVLLQSVGFSQRGNPSEVQNLIGVDVADAGEDPLVHQRGFDSPRRLSQPFRQIVERAVEGVGA